MDPFIQFRLNDKVAIVTGGAGLLGQAFCHTLASAGANVVVADINHEPGEAQASSLRKEGFEAQYCHVDVKNPESTHDLTAFTVEKYGRIDILVNSAALDPKVDPMHALPGQNFVDFPLALWEEALDVNLTGLFLTSQAVLRHMERNAAGVIINLCSTYGLVGPDQRIYEREDKPRQYKPAFYSTTKAGVLGFTRYLATYYAGTRIRVNALTPGGIYNDHDEAFVKQYSARTVLGRMARGDEMNGALLFLASDASSYMTGSNLVVDGGWTAW